MEYKNIAGKVLMETVMQSARENAEGVEAISVVTWLKPSHFASKEQAKEHKLLCAHLAETCEKYSYGKLHAVAMQEAMDMFNSACNALDNASSNPSEFAEVRRNYDFALEECKKYATKGELHNAIDHVLNFYLSLVPSTVVSLRPTNNDYSEVYERSVSFRKEKTELTTVRSGMFSGTACAHAVQELSFLLQRGEHFPKRKLNKATTTTLFKEAEEKRKKAEQEAENKKRSELQEKQEAEKAMETVKKEEEAKKKRSTTSKKDTTTKESGVRVKKQDTTTKTETNKQ